MSFLPEDDRDYLDSKGLVYDLKEEPGGKKRGIRFPTFAFAGSLYTVQESGLVACRSCELMVIIPEGYDATRLDSFYTRPFLKTRDGSNPDAAKETQNHFGVDWQFWSRHLTDDEWKMSVRGFEVYIPYIHAALKAA